MKKIMITMAVLAMIAMAMTGCTERGDDLTAAQAQVVAGTFSGLTTSALTDAQTNGTTSRATLGSETTTYELADGSLRVVTEAVVKCGILSDSGFEMNTLYQFDGYSETGMSVDFIVDGHQINSVDVELTGDYAISIWATANITAGTASAGFEMGEAGDGLLMKISGADLTAAGIAEINTYINCKLRIEASANALTETSGYTVDGSINGITFDEDDDLGNWDTGWFTGL